MPAIKILTKEDRRCLIDLGYSASDITEINYAARKTIIRKDDGGKTSDITPDEARAILGQKKFLSGLGRSSFHWTATREGPGGVLIHFDSTPAYQ